MTRRGVVVAAAALVACAKSSPPPASQPATATVDAGEAPDSGDVAISGDVSLDPSKATVGTVDRGTMFGHEADKKTIEVPLSEYTMVSFSDMEATSSGVPCKVIKAAKTLGEAQQEEFGMITWHLTDKQIGKHAVVVECTKNKKKVRTSTTIVVTK